jgi:hypothetical protein
MTRNTPVQFHDAPLGSSSPPAGSGETAVSSDVAAIAAYGALCAPQTLLVRTVCDLR